MAAPFFKKSTPFLEKSALHEKIPMRHIEKSGPTFLYVSFLHKSSQMCNWQPTSTSSIFSSIFQQSICTHKLLSFSLL